MARLLKRWASLQVLWPSRLLLLNAGASPQRLLQIDWHAMLLEQIGEGFLREFLQRRHPVPADLRQRGHRLVDRASSTVFFGSSLAARLPPPLIGSNISL